MKKAQDYYYDDYYTGMKFEVPPVTFTEEEIIEFAKEFDPLPIHIDKDYAANHSRFKDLIASGYHTLIKVWGAWVKMGYESDKTIAGVGMDEVLWLSPVYPGDILTSVVEIVNLIPTSRDTQGIVEVRLVSKNQRGQEVITMRVKGLVKKRPVKKEE